jgi:hypothetical protein
MRRLLNAVLTWYRSLPVFAWHNSRINELWLMRSTQRERADDEVECWITRWELEKSRADILRARLDEWIARREGSVKLVADKTGAYVRQLEAHANKQAKMLNWIAAELKTVYPDILDKARRKTHG